MLRSSLHSLATLALVTVTVGLGLVHGVDPAAASAVTLPADVTWMPLGEPLRGQQAGDAMGSSIAMSADGRVMVLGLPGDDRGGADGGAVTVAEWNGDDWVTNGPKGATFTGSAGERTGISLAISADASTIAIASRGPSLEGGRVEVHRWVNGTWQPVGAPFLGTPASPVNRVALSADGTTIVLGRPLDDTPIDGGLGTDRGAVEVLDWDGTTWQRRGDVLRGAAGDTLGWSIGISPDGDTLVAGAPWGDHGGTSDTGYVIVLDWDGGSWRPRPVLGGTEVWEQFGSAVALDAAATVLAVGAPGAPGVAQAPFGGAATTHSWDGSTWTPMGAPVRGLRNDLLGVSIALDAAGDTMAVSSLEYDTDSDTDVGRVQVLDWDATAWQPRAWPLDGEAAGDLAATVALSADGTTVVIGRAGDDINGADAGSVHVFTTAVVRPRGAPLIGTEDFAEAGRATALNLSGDTVAVGMPGVLGGPHPGRVEVHRWQGGAWTLLGAPLVGAATDDSFGGSVALDAAGDTLVVGAPTEDSTGVDAGRVRVYDWTGTAWVRRGAELDGPAAGAEFGASLDIDSAGDRIIVGAPGAHTDRGETTVWHWSGAAWVPVGVALPGTQIGDRSGASVALSAQGDAMAIGDPGYDIPAQLIIAPPAGFEVQPALATADAGRARVFTLSGVNWQQRGPDIEGINPFESLGTAVDIDATGTTFAVGIPDAARVQVHRWTGAAWTLRGTALDGEAPADRFGLSVTLSVDGTTLAVGGPLNDGAAPNAGHARLFRFQGGDWRQLGEDLDGLMAGEETGHHLALSGDGTVLAVGSPVRIGLRPGDGAVSVYQVSRWSPPAPAPAPAATSLDLPGEPSPLVLTGDDAPGLAVAVSRYRFAGPVPTVYLTTAATFPDALVGGVAAARAAGPVLLADRAEVPEVTRIELLRLRPQRIVIVGGTTAIGEEVAEQLRTLAPVVTRLGGTDRFATAAEVARALHTPEVEVVYVVSGASHVDAMVVAPMAAAEGAPVLLTGPDRVPEVTVDALHYLAARRVVVVGGPRTISDDVLVSLSGGTAPVERLYGPDLSRTALAIAARDWAHRHNPVIMVDRSRVGDALALTPLAATRRYPVLVTEGPCTSAAVLEELRIRRAQVILATTDTPAAATRAMARRCGTQ